MNDEGQRQLASRRALDWRTRGQESRGPLGKLGAQRALSTASPRDHQRRLGPHLFR